MQALTLVPLITFYWWGSVLLLQSLVRFVSDDGVFPALFAASALFAIYSVRLFYKASKADLAYASLCIIVILLSASIFTDRWDMLWDSVAYHIPAIMALVEGWNPVREHHDLLWANHYPNGWWSLQASFIALTHLGIEAGRALTPLLWCATGLLCVRASHVLWHKKHAWRTIIILLLLVNPIIITQAPTHLTDGVTALLTLCVGAALIIALSTQRFADYFLLAATIILCINTKMSAPYWAGAICAVVLLCSFVITKKLPFKAAALCLVTACIALGIVGFKPYVTNLRDTGMLVYPPSTSHLPNHYPAGVADMNYVERLSRLLTLPLGNDEFAPIWQWSPALLKERHYTQLWQQHIAVSFAPACLFALCTLCIITLKRRDLYIGTIWIASFSWLVACVMFPENWNFRFVPLLWGVPALMLSSVIYVSHSSLSSCFAQCCAFGAVICLALASVLHSYYDIGHINDLRVLTKSQLNSVLQENVYPTFTNVPADKTNKLYSYQTWQVRFEALGVQIKQSDSSTCQKDNKTLSSFAFGGMHLCY